MAKIGEALIESGRCATAAEVKAHFVAARGALALDLRTGQAFHVPTITPARKPNGACVFLDGAVCTIHEVSPFGCAFFDHLPEDEVQRRSVWAHREIARSSGYAMLRDELAPAQVRR